MPVGLLELTLAGGGVAGGYALGSRLRQAVHDAAAKLGIDSANDEQQQTQQAGGLQVLKDSTLTVTMMLVGEPSVGKSLFLARICSDDGSPGRSVLQKTLVPAWLRADVMLTNQPRAVSTSALTAPAGRVVFQCLDTPGSLPELSVPFYRGVQSVVLMFDVGQASTFAKLKSHWHAAVTQHRLDAPGNRHPRETTVVLAHVVDERRTREVTRRVASAWCASVGLPFFETSPTETMPKVLAHLAHAIHSENQNEKLAPSARETLQS